MQRSLGRKVAWLAGAGVVAVAGVAAVEGPAIAKAYHRMRLRGNPEYFVRLMREPDGTAARRALEESLTTREGRATMARASILGVDLVEDPLVSDLIGFGCGPQRCTFEGLKMSWHSAPPAAPSLGEEVRCIPKGFELRVFPGNLVTGPYPEVLFTVWIAFKEPSIPCGGSVTTTP